MEPLICNGFASLLLSNLVNGPMTNSVNNQGREMYQGMINSTRETLS